MLVALVVVWLLFPAGVSAIAAADRLLARRARRAELAERVRGDRLPLAAAGLCVVRGAWQPLGPGRGLVIGARHTVVVEHARAAPIAPTPSLLVFGVVRGEADDPRGGDYRRSPRLVRIAAPAGAWIGPVDQWLARAARRDRWALLGAQLWLLGAALFLGLFALAVLLLFGAW